MGANSQHYLSRALPTRAPAGAAGEGGRGRSPSQLLCRWVGLGRGGAFVASRPHAQQMDKKLAYRGVSTSIPESRSKGPGLC